MIAAILRLPTSSAATDIAEAALTMWVDGIQSRPPTNASRNASTQSPSAYLRITLLPARVPSVPFSTSAIILRAIAVEAPSPPISAIISSKRLACAARPGALMPHARSERELAADAPRTSALMAPKLAVILCNVSRSILLASGLLASLTASSRFSIAFFQSEV